MPKDKKTRIKNATKMIKARKAAQDFSRITVQERVKKAVSGRVMATALAGDAISNRKRAAAGGRMKNATEMLKARPVVEDFSRKSVQDRLIAASSARVRTTALANAALISRMRRGTSTDKLRGRKSTKVDRGMAAEAKLAATGNTVKRATGVRKGGKKVAVKGRNPSIRLQALDARVRTSDKAAKARAVRSDAVAASGRLGPGVKIGSSAKTSTDRLKSRPASASIPRVASAPAGGVRPRFKKAFNL